MRFVICDDEPEYRRLLHDRILQYSFAQNFEIEVAEYDSGEKLIAALDAGERADVYFLDIQMESGADDGIRVAKELRSRGENSLIVYVTGFIDYAQTGYEVKAFRYLLKSQICRSAQYSGVPRQDGAVRHNEVVQYNEALPFQDKLAEVLSAIIKELEGEGFLRCHKSYLVNMKQIQKYSREQISLKGGAVVPVGRSYAKECMRRLMVEMV